MKSLIFNPLSCLILIMLTSFTVIGRGKECHLTINITNISAIKGDIYIAVYDSKDAFKNKNAVFSRRMKVTATNENLTVALPEGEYAVILYQDLNGNKKLDRMFSIPLEPYGVSNNIKGKPSFDSIKFLLQKEQTISINIKN